VPQSGLAQDLAQALLTDHFDLPSFEMQPLRSFGGFADVEVISLRRP